MCLQRVDKVTRKGTGIGYKVFTSDESYHTTFFVYGGRIKYNVWYHDKATERICINDKKSYPAGYHIFLSLRGAEKWLPGGKFRKVQYEDVVASGIQENHPVIVARKIYIMKGKV